MLPDWNWWRWFAVIVLIVGVWFLSSGCSTGMKREDIDNQIALWKGAVDCVKESGIDATIAMEVETQPGEVYAKQSFGLAVPLRARLTLMTNVKPEKTSVATP